MTDIVERLEKARLILARDDDGTIWHTLKDAKAEIERLRAELAEERKWKEVHIIAIRTAIRAVTIVECAQTLADSGYQIDAEIIRALVALDRSEVIEVNRKGDSP